ncbi:MAG: DUF3107 domain-containing protein [Corynebacterium sp.]|nr:DUF3107 domain-containing protein [Corynebacterium sp.]
MEIKIGFVESPRELVINAASDNDVQQQVTSALEAGEGILKLADQRGRNYVVRVSTVAYVEFGEGQPRAVGFASA